MSVGGSNGTTTSYDMAYAKPVINDAVNLFTKSFAQLQSGASAFSKGDELFTYTNKLNVTITNFAMSTTNDGGSQAVRSAALDAQRLNISALQGAVTGNGQSSIKSLNQSTGLLLNSLGVDTKPIAVSILLNKAQEATTSADKASSLLKALDILKGASTSSTLTTAPTQSPANVIPMPTYTAPIGDTTPTAPVQVPADFSGNKLKDFSNGLGNLIKFVDGANAKITEADQTRILSNLGAAVSLLNQMASDPSKNTAANNKQLRDLVTSAVAPLLSIQGAESVIAKVVQALGAVTQQPTETASTSPNVNLSTALGINVALNSLRPVIANDGALSAEDKAQANALMASITSKAQAIATPGGQTAAAVSSLAADLSGLVSLVQSKGSVLGSSAYNRAFDELAGAIRAANLTVPSLGASGVSS